MARLPAPLHARFEAAAAAYFDAPGLNVDFTAPVGAPALFAPDSVTWRVMKNPVALTIGGIAAVILELAEPRVRTGVWEHTSFRRDPVTRMKRTGMAAMVTIYAPAEKARAMIAGIVRAHGRIEGVTPAGAPYRANDEELLTWVQATAGYGFVEAYNRFVRPLTLRRWIASTSKARRRLRSTARTVRRARRQRCARCSKRWRRSSSARRSCSTFLRSSATRRCCHRARSSA